MFMKLDNEGGVFLVPPVRTVCRPSAPTIRFLLGMNLCVLLDTTLHLPATTRVNYLLRLFISRSLRLLVYYLL